MAEMQHNWADNITYTAANVYYPTTTPEVQDLVRRSSKVRALGSRHSFNTIVDTPGDLISVERFDPNVEIDRTRHTVTVAAGIRYGQLCDQLHRAGYALPNLASLPHISIAGACATATHGSGNRNGCLSTAVSALEIVTADGSLIRLSRDKDGEEFFGAVVSLGGLGVITRMTLDLEPTFEVQQYAYENLPFAQMLRHFDDITARAYSVSFFTDWRNNNVNQVWLKHRAGDPNILPEGADLYGAAPATGNRHPIPGISAVNCTAQMGIAGPWYDRLPHFRMEFTPSSGEELQTEFLIPRQRGIVALGAVNALHESISPLLQASEIRMIAADELWMSPFYKQDCVAIHFTWQKNWPAVKAIMPHIEAALSPYEARPHWGKLFTMSGDQVQARYKKLSDFRMLLKTHDPNGKFRNAFLDSFV